MNGTRNFGTLVEFSAANSKDPGDYLIGEKLRSSGAPLRYMDKPSKDGSSADCWSRSVGRLDVHYSSGVANHFFYLLAVGSGSSSYGNSPTCNG
ncbi:M4 family metallopeptidase, partial [Micromonospora sp. NPDC004540]|uniref:M4 family metallopeptidase n=1 Tax=Micromonospora sp. NPDC004540 TaxID=3154457 RepID=UPI0033B92622